MKKNQALVVVDVQNDFLEKGALPVPAASEVVPVINKIAPLFDTVVFTQDWHPQNHISFASQHEGGRVMSSLTYLTGNRFYGRITAFRKRSDLSLPRDSIQVGVPLI